MTRHKELVATLVRAFASEPDAEILASQAGLEQGTFPIKSPDMNSLWYGVVSVLSRQGKLRALMQKAAEQPIRPEYQQHFKRFELEMSVKENLVPFITRSALSSNDLLALYDRSFSDYVNYEKADDADSMIFNLWDYRERHPLMRFMLLIAAHTTNRVARTEIHNWYNKTDTPELIKLTRADLNMLWQSIEASDPQSTQPRRYLMVVVESTQRGSADTYWVSLLSGLEIDSPVNISSRTKVTADTLKPYLIKELDKAFLRYTPLEANARDEAIRTIEFYLPSSLLAKAVEPHLWDVSHSKLMRQATVVIGITERHKALNIAKTIQRKLQGGPANKVEYRKLKGALNRDKQMLLLFESALWWVRRWKSLNSPSAKLFNAIVGPVYHNETTPLSRLHERLDQQQSWACVVFAFSSDKLESVKFGDLLEEVLGAGLPIILWTYEPKVPDSEAHEVTSAFFKQHIFDKYGDKQIDRAADIVELFHECRKGNFDPADANVGEHLTIVLDNPDREIPQLQRAPK